MTEIYVVILLLLHILTPGCFHFTITLVSFSMVMNQVLSITRRTVDQIITDDTIILRPKHYMHVISLRTSFDFFNRDCDNCVCVLHSVLQG